MSESILFESADIPALVAQIQRLPRSDRDILLLLIAEHAALDVNALIAALNEHHIPVVGGIFPGVIYGDKKYDAAVVGAILPTLAAPTVIRGLDTSRFQVGDLPVLSPERQDTALVLVDGLTKHVALFLERLFGISGSRIQYIGGGAGSLSFVQKPCVFDNQGVYQDAALVIWLKITTSLGVRHGWQQVRGPFVATHTTGTQIFKLSNQPAYKVYSQNVNMLSGKTLTKENFFSIAKEYPLGIYHPGMDHIVRDPITFTDAGALVCVGEVPANSLVYILRGDRKSLIAHAHLATTEAVTDTPHTDHSLIFDCISRVLFLDDEFGQELNAVLRALPPGAAVPYGVLSLGEIATFKTGKVEFFNKTLVVGSLQNVP